MARLTPITSKNQVATKDQAIVDGIVKSRGALQGPFTMFLHSPELAGRLAHLGAFVRFEGSLDMRVRVLAAMTVARWMTENRRAGSIINLASIMSRMPSTSAAYSVSKAGVWMLTKCLAQELAGHGIRVNAIGPGFIETPMTAALREDAARSRWAMSVTPMARYGRPEEIAATALFLASDDASYFTGELLHPSGGVFVG